MRTVLAVVAGGLAAVLCYWGGAVLTLLVLRGLPLGSAGGAATPTELTVHLALGLLASLTGAAVAVRLSLAPPYVPAGALGLLLGIGVLVGFGKPGSQWPAWFPAALAFLCLVGTGSAAVWSGKRG